MEMDRIGHKRKHEKTILVEKRDRAKIGRTETGASIRVDAVRGRGQTSYDYTASFSTEEIVKMLMKSPSKTIADAVKRNLFAVADDPERLEALREKLGKIQKELLLGATDTTEPEDEEERVVKMVPPPAKAYIHGKVQVGRGPIRSAIGNQTMGMK